LGAAKGTIGLKKSVRKKTWISDDTFQIMAEKREMKQKNPARYKELKTLVQKCLRRDKQKQLGDLCDELDTANQRGNMRCLFRTAKSITQTFRSRLHCIQTASGRNFTEQEEIADRWREYCVELHNDEDTPELDHQFEREPPRLRQK